MTNNEKTAHNRAYAAIASMRAVRQDMRLAYYEACSNYDRAYVETYKKHFASLEAEELTRRKATSEELAAAFVAPLKEIAKGFPDLSFRAIGRRIFGRKT